MHLSPNFKKASRTEDDKSYRQGWIDAVEWIHQEMQEIFHPRDNKNSDAKIE